AARIDLERTEGAHRIDDQAPATPGNHLSNLMQRIENAGAGLAVHQRHVRDRGILRERTLDVGRGHLGILGVIERRQVAAEHAADPGDALTVGTVLRYEHVAVAWHQSADRGFDREGAATLERNAFVRTAAVHDL